MKSLEEPNTNDVQEVEVESDIDLNSEDEYQVVDEIQLKYDQLNERFISLKTIFETLKNQVDKEKVLWKQELKATIEMEKTFRDKQTEHYKMLLPDESEMKRKFEIFRDFLFFTQTTENIEKLTRKNNYQQWLSEVESECSLELDRIQKSLTALKPLQEMASKWKEKVLIYERGADGDTGNDAYTGEEKHVGMVEESCNATEESEINS